MKNDNARSRVKQIKSEVIVVKSNDALSTTAPNEIFLQYFNKKKYFKQQKNNFLTEFSIDSNGKSFQNITFCDIDKISCLSNLK